MKKLYFLLIILIFTPISLLYTQKLIFDTTAYFMNLPNKEYKQELFFIFIYDSEDTKYKDISDDLQDSSNWNIHKKDISNSIFINSIETDKKSEKRELNKRQRLLTEKELIKNPNYIIITIHLKDIIDDNIIIEYKDKTNTVKFKTNVRLTPYKDKIFNYLKFNKKDISFKRLGDNSAKFTLDYGLDMKLLELELNDIRKPVLFNFGLGFNSTGTLANKDDVKNGVQSSIELSLNTTYYFYDGLIYDANISGGYQFESKSNISTGNYFEIVNKSPKLSAMAEIPYTSLPFYYLHSITGYMRRAMPFTCKFDYYPDGKDPGGNTTPSRYDLNFKYEGAFSKYFIVKTEYNYTKFINDNIPAIKTADYFSVSYGFELSVLGDLIPILKSILKTDNEINDKDANYLYFKIENGRKPPLFQPGNQQSLGFAIYF